jgi:hypothetical protein
VGLTTIRRAELADSETSMTAANDVAVRRALEAAGVEFIDENGGGPGVRLRKSGKEKASYVAFNKITEIYIRILSYDGRRKSWKRRPQFAILAV